MRAVVLPCYPDGSWVERDPLTNGTIWRGYAIWQLMDVFKMQAIPSEEIQVVHNVTSNTTRNQFVQTIMDGKADLCPFVLGMTQDRVQQVDYVYHLIAVELVILSKMKRLD